MCHSPSHASSVPADEIRRPHRRTTDTTIAVSTTRHHPASCSSRPARSTIDPSPIRCPLGRARLRSTACGSTRTTADRSYRHPSRNSTDPACSACSDRRNRGSDYYYDTIWSQSKSPQSLVFHPVCLYRISPNLLATTEHRNHRLPSAARHRGAFRTASARPSNQEHHHPDRIRSRHDASRGRHAARSRRVHQGNAQNYMTFPPHLIDY
jgi:hypothetical protein